MKPPKLTTSEKMDALAETEDMARVSIGIVVVKMMRAGDTISSEAIVSTLQAIADGRTRDDNLPGTMAKGALRFISKMAL